LLFYCSVAGQYVISIKRFGIEDGLSHREVNAILKDKRGFIWVGTRYGINRFDGYSFTWYTSEKNGLPFNNIKELAEDGEGNLWIRGGNQAREIAILNTVTRNFIPVSKKLAGSRPFTADLVHSCQDGSVIFYSKNESHLLRYIPGKGFQKEVIPESLKTPLTQVQSLLADDTWWFERSDAIERYNLKGKLLFRLPAQSTEGLFTQSTGVGFKDKKQRYRFILKNQQIVDVTSALPPFDPTGGDMLFYTGTDDIYWRQGKLFSLGKGMLKDFGSEGHPDLKTYLRFVLPDGQGKIWIGNNFGLYLLDIKPNLFQRFFHGKTAINKTSNSYRGIWVDKNQLWACNELQGLVSASLEDQQTPKSVFKNENEIVYYQLIKSTDSNWVIGGLRNVYIISPNRQITTIRLKGDDAACWAIQEMPNHQLLLGLQSGLGWLDKKSQQFTPFRQYNQFQELATAHVLSIRTFDSTNYWICTNQGLYLFQLQKGIVERYYSAAEGNRFLPSNEFQHIFRDSEGIYWLATTNGLIRWNQKQARLFTRADGLSNNNIYAVYGDAAGNLWLSCDYGIMRFNRSNFSVTTFLTEDGLTNTEFNRISHHQDSSGRIYFGSLSGITGFQPSSFNEDNLHKASLPLAIASLQKFNGDSTVDQTAIAFNNEVLNLYPEDEYFTLQVALLNFKDPEQVTYYWCVGDETKQWNAQKERTFRFSRLPYGETVLRIKAQAPDGQWSDKELRIVIFSHKPFFLRWWFISLVVLLMLLLVYLRIRWKTRKLQKENSRLDAVIQQRTGELQVSLQQKELLLKEIHHRVKNNLQVISSLLELQTASVGDDQTVKAAITEGQNRLKSIALIHQRLYQHDQVSTIEFGGFFQELFNQVASVLKKPYQEVQTLFEIPETHLDIDTAIPLGLICNEVITNAFKYGFAEQDQAVLTATLAVVGPAEYELHLSDNGPGLPAHFEFANANSLGLRLIRRLARQIGGSTKYTYKSGTTFVIRFRNSENETV
jgi:two-component sensor histidine kinase/ligand-binding sensor domain-containing protein